MKPPNQLVLCVREEERREKREEREQEMNESAAKRVAKKGRMKSLN